MRTPFLRISVLVLLLCSGTTVWSQSIWNQVLGTVGGQGTVGGNTISFTAGEVISGTAPLAVVKLSQGFHQTTYTVTVGLTASNSRELTANIYPNPSSGEVTISLSDLPDQLTLRLFDITGKKLNEQRIVANQTSIDLDQYASGLYIFQLSNPSGIDQITRVQKIH